jgi:hypothetical protein
MRRLVLGLAGALAVSPAACSLFTSFPEVEATSGAGAGGSTTSSQGGGGATGSGGGYTCDGATCENCFGAAFCPAQLDTVATLVGPNDAALQKGFVALSDGTETVENHQIRFIGSFFDVGGTGLDLDASNSISATTETGVGFVLDETGGQLVAASPCDAVSSSGGGSPGGGLAFFAAIASPYDSVVDLSAFAGEFQGNYLAFFTDPAQGCRDTMAVAARSGPMAFTPFIAWVDQYGTIAHSVGPDVPSGGSAVFTDVAAFDAFPTPDTYHGRVVAVGVAQGKVFSQMPDFSGPHHFLYSARPDDAQLYAEVPARVPCEAEVFDDLDTIDAAVAIDGVTKKVWHAGTGCPNSSDVARGFLDVYDMNADGSFASGTVSQRVLGNLEDPLRITKIALGPSLVVLAGKYEDAPEITGLIPESGTPGDAFVVAFVKDTYTNAATPLWFRRFDARGGDAKILDVQVFGEGVYVTGRAGPELAVGSELACAAPPLEGPRAFVAALAASDGTLAWLRVDGTLPPQPSVDVEMRRAAASFIFPAQSTGEVFTSIDSVGDLLLECGGGVTSPTKPTSRLRLFIP